MDFTTQDFTLKHAKKIAELYSINLKVVPIKQLLYGLNVEKEHTNITHHDPKVIIKIVLAHLKEYPDYYKRLKRMENAADKYWANKDPKMKHIFN